MVIPYTITAHMPTQQPAQHLWGPLRARPVCTCCCAHGRAGRASIRGSASCVVRILRVNVGLWRFIGQRRGRARSTIALARSMGLQVCGRTRNSASMCTAHPAVARTYRLSDVRRWPEARATTRHDTPTDPSRCIRASKAPAFMTAAVCVLNQYSEQVQR